ncbi:MAG: bifunctional diaminohydroxyphosphoribosylaminopyrimidine deaminase/5-amino-6-(5-phosphoribosylamino)uracil reductase RibD [Hyphomicrobiaceae bacterium]|nr:bifunctional diaminohydroxyphosphoribosylaminopyrimidine deaminase/5-amino-6-(5-phosphoribosylamino)uracil reductase RibD [Hyphomicrobiaceae bacterium]
MMGIALALARRGLGRTAPNPAVGAVIADPDTREVIARAVTAPGGRPHAEPLALAAASDRAHGTTLYVTLEPCSHHGQTSPCADAIVAAGISRVVAAIEDPDPRVAGRGLDRLRAAGISVTRGIRSDEAHVLTRGHIYRIAQRRPFVQLKLALAGDGSVPQGTAGHPVFATSAEARALGHLMRAEADAILVGSGTLKADNPELTCRLPGLSDRSPVRVVLTNSPLNLGSSRLTATVKTAPVIVFAGLAAEPNAGVQSGASRVPGLLDGPIDGVSVETVSTVGGMLWLPAVVERLAELGVTRVLVEGGPRIWRAFTDAGLADEAVLFVAGGAHVAPPQFAQMLGQLARAHLGWTKLHIVDERIIGPDRVAWLRPR